MGDVHTVTLYVLLILRAHSPLANNSTSNEEMACVYTEIHVFLALLVQERLYEDSVGQRHSAGGI